MQITTRLGGLTCTVFMLLGLTIPASIKPAAAKTITPTQREIQAIYNKINAALAQKDADTVYDYDTDDFEFYNTKGHRVDLAEGRQDLVDVLANIDTVQQKTMIIGFTGSDSEATVTVQSHAFLFSANTVTGRAIKFTINETDRDYWVKTEDGWRLKRSREIKGKVGLHKNF